MSSGVTYLINSSELISPPEFLRLSLRGPEFLVNEVVNLNKYFPCSWGGLRRRDQEITCEHEDWEIRSFRESFVSLTKFSSLNSLKRTITIYRSCVTCKKLKGSFGWINMSDLTRATIHICGHRHFWNLAYCLQKNDMQRNLNCSFCSYVCMVSRAVHVEFIEELSSFSFIIALCRFMAIRGPVK